jgi:hypothetical protein
MYRTHRFYYYYMFVWFFLKTFSVLYICGIVTAVEGQGQTRTLGTQPRGRTRCLDVHRGRVGCCDHRSEEEGKTVGNNIRTWWKRQNKKLEQGNLKRNNIQEIS